MGCSCHHVGFELKSVEDQMKDMKKGRDGIRDEVEVDPCQIHPEHGDGLWTA